MQITGKTYKSRTALALSAFLLALPLLWTPRANASPIPFKRGEVHYRPQSQPLTAFLQRFFSDQGLQVIVSPQLSARSTTVSGERSGTAQKLFSSLSADNDLVSYYDGSAVYVYLAQERTTRYVNLPPARVEDFVASYQRMHFGDDSVSGNTFSATSGNGLVMITGAPRFVDQVMQLAEAVNGQAGETNTIFKYYKLRYAWAADQTMTIGNRQQTVPGVAALLRQLVSPNAPSPMNEPQERLLRPTATKLRGSGLASIGQPPLTPPGQGDVRPDSTESTAIPPSPNTVVDASNGARIVADTFRNAIIIRDTPDRFPMYDRLIGALDTEPQMIEIEATIIDVDKGKMKNLGVNWRYRNNGGRGEVDFLPGINANNDKNNFSNTIRGVNPNGTARGDNIDTLGQLAGFQLGAIIGDSSRFLLRINALASDDITNVVARPQVVTLNDTEAVIENTQSVYVPVAGAYDVDLFNVVAGTTLRVTPHVIYENGVRRIRTMVQIEDGGVTLNQTTTNGQTVNVPLVTRKAVNTQALIDEGQSLLLGGLVTDTVQNNNNKIPLLGDIPLIGALFRQVNKDREHVERLFLITPRLLAANQITGQQTPSTPNVNVDEITRQQGLRDHAEQPWASSDEKARENVPVDSTQPIPTNRATNRPPPVITTPPANLPPPPTTPPPPPPPPPPAGSKPVHPAAAASGVTYPPSTSPAASPSSGGNS